jgi:hypothetical protein
MERAEPNHVLSTSAKIYEISHHIFDAGRVNYLTYTFFGDHLGQRYGAPFVSPARHFIGLPNLQNPHFYWVSDLFCIYLTV